MKIAMFSDSFPPIVDGVANVVLRSAEELSNLGHEVHVFTVSNTHDRKGEKESELEKYNFNVIRLPAVPVLIYSGYRFGIPSGIALREIKRIKPDIIHIHTPFSVGWQSIGLAKFLGIPLVGTHHTFYNHYLKHLKLDYEWAKKISWKYVISFYNNCDITTCPSKSLANEMKSHGLTKSALVLPNPVNNVFFRAVENENIKVKYKKLFGIQGKSLVYMGRVSYEKNIDKVIRATAYVNKKMPGIQLMIIGDGPEREKLELLAEELGIKERVIFTKFCHGENLVSHLQANDIFLSASKTETFSLAILEGMACGLPVVAANALAIPEVVSDGVNGFLVPADKPKMMAERILKLLDDEKMLKKFSQASIDLASNYSQKEVFVKSLEKIYSDILDNK